MKFFDCIFLYYSTTPELPDFLKPTVKPTVRPLRPIDDIDLPDGSFVIQPGKEEEEETEEDKGMYISKNAPFCKHQYKMNKTNEKYI